MHGTRLADWDLALLGITRDGSDNGLPAPLDTAATPTQLIWGAQDTWIRLRVGQRWHEQLEGAAFAIIDDAGHLPMMETPDQFNQILLMFLVTNSEQ